LHPVEPLPGNKVGGVLTALSKGLGEARGILDFREGAGLYGIAERGKRFPGHGPARRLIAPLYRLRFRAMMRPGPTGAPRRHDHGQYEERQGAAESFGSHRPVMAGSIRHRSEQGFGSLRFRSPSVSGIGGKAARVRWNRHGSPPADASRRQQRNRRSPVDAAMLRFHRIVPIHAAIENRRAGGRRPPDPCVEENANRLTGGGSNPAKPGAWTNHHAAVSRPCRIRRQKPRSTG